MKSIISTSAVMAQGERGAIGGYKPQYDEFARCVYDKLLHRELVCIRVADDKVGKLDDIYYETATEIHAYQMKWSINEGETISFNAFKKLFPLIADSWKLIKNNNPNKLVIPHFVTCKPLSENDDIKDNNNDTKIGSFKKLSNEAFTKLKDDNPYDAKWKFAIDALHATTKLTRDELKEFWKVFVFTTGYAQERLSVSESQVSKRTEDALKLDRMIVEMAASREREVFKTRDEIIKILGWESRFRTQFNHYLHIDESQYEPIHATIGSLNAMLCNHNKGYIFLQGSPGSGKSTLLAQWTDTVLNNVVSYYAFDFMEPSSGKNYRQRGEDVTLLHDLVVMLEERGFKTQSKTLVSYDLSDLVDRFDDQLLLMSKDYKESGKSNIIVIDGLDHVPREYTDCVHSFIGILPTPSKIPEGVIIILGSQKYTHLDKLQPEILKEYKLGKRTVPMSPFSKEEMGRLVSRKLPAMTMTAEQLEKLYNKTQGHPLYLRYIVENLKTNNDIDQTLEAVSPYTDDIECYYSRMIEPALENVNLKDMLGLVSHIVGPIHWDFVKEWGMPKEAMDLFSKKVKSLLNCDNKHKVYTFFHNSFRQYLLYVTTIDSMTEQPDHAIDLDYYSRLADYYIHSKVEPTWQSGYYLFRAERNNEFLQIATPSCLESQLQDFRPSQQVTEEAQRGLEVARQHQDAYLMIRYLLMLSEMEQIGNQDFSTIELVPDFLKMGLDDVAKSNIRQGRTLHCTIDYALKQSRTFFARGDKEEASLLFELAYPTFLYEAKCDRMSWADFDSKYKTLRSWVHTATYFIDITELINRINAFVVYLLKVAKNTTVDADDLRLSFIRSIMHSLIEQHRWIEFDKFMVQWQSDKTSDKQNLFGVYREAINTLIANNDIVQAQKYYYQLREFSESWIETPCLIILADFSLRLGIEIEAANKLIENVDWTELPDWHKWELDDKFIRLRPLIRLFLIRRICGYNDSVLTLIPDAKVGSDDVLLVDFVRNISFMAQLMADGRKGQLLPYDFEYRVRRFMQYYGGISNHFQNRYWNNISSFQEDYYSLMINMAYSFGIEGVNRISNLFFEDFRTHPNHWAADVRRIIILKLSKTGLDSEKCISQLIALETMMFDSQDVTNRVNECVEQGRAWLALGYSKNCLSWFKRAIKETFGVGYSKDYQPRFFVDWIRRVNSIDPTRAEERFQWFTQRLRSLEQISDDSSYAVKALLKAAFDQNLSTGLKMMLWMLDTEQTTFHNAFNTLLHCLIPLLQTPFEYCQLFDIYIRLYLYFDTTNNGDSELLKLVVQQGQKTLNNDFRRIILPALENAIHTQALESARKNLLKALSETLHPEEKSDKKNANSLHEEKKPSTFDWLKLGENSLVQGNKDLAWQQAEEAFARSNPSGWSRFYDGGTRIRTFQLMVRLKPQEAHKRVFDVLAKDITEGYPYPMMDYIDEILPLLTENVDYLHAYEEIFDYMNRLMRADTVTPTDCPDLKPDEDKATHILFRFLFSMTELHIKELYENVAFLLASFIDQNQTDIIDMIAVQPHHEQLLLDVAKFLIVLKSSNLSLLKNLVIPLATSTNYRWRTYACDVLKSLGIPAPQAKMRQLPATYNLYLKQKQKVDFGNKKDFYFPEVDWDDPLDVIAPVSHLCQKLSDVSGFKKLNIAIRICYLMLQNDRPEELTIEAEKKLQQHLKAIYLRYSYPRPRAVAAIRGIMEAATELIDANVVDPRSIRTMFETYDHAVITWSEVEKPAFVHYITEEHFGGVQKGWEKRIGESPRWNTPLQQYNGNYVIGELTELITGDSSKPSETYMQQISIFFEVKEGTYFFGDSPIHRLSADYLTLGVDSSIIVVRENFFFQFSLKSRWIAINPDLAQVLGWIPSHKGLFAWDDTTGRRMAESVYWRNGNTNAHEQYACETGEGWFVIITPEALTQIKNIITVELYQQKKISRTYKGKEYKAPIMEVRIESIE
jgi:hypothetical protein